MNFRSLVLIAAAGATAAFLYSRSKGRVPALPEDLRLEAAVRRRLAEVVADPGAIHITVHGGNATLSGPVLPGERDRALSAVLDVPGVLQVTNLLEPVEPAQPIAT